VRLWWFGNYPGVEFPGRWIHKWLSRGVKAAGLEVELELVVEEMKGTLR
jgi:hypothetical protein